MKRRQKWALAPLLLLAACAPLPAQEPEVAFGALGDAPYSREEIRRLDAVIDAINREALDFVVHVGDIGTSGQACRDEWLKARRAQLARIRHPFLLLPGDNEWSDCSNPRERLAHWRALFCHRETIAGLSRQPGEYCEHVRWEARGWVFVALNVPGGASEVDDAVLAWLAEAAALAEPRKGLVVLMQANPFSPMKAGGYGRLRERLRVLGERMPGRVLLVHGDTHLYTEDEPLPGVRRIEVWGSPFVAWTRVTLPRP